MIFKGSKQQNSYDENQVGEDENKSIKDAAKALKDSAGNLAGAVAEKAAKKGKAVASSKFAKAATNTASSVAGAIAEKASEAASDVKTTVNKGMNVVKENSPAALLKKARIEGFRNGIDQGAYLTGQKKYNFYYAYLATLVYFLRLDDSYSEEYQDWLAGELKHLRLQGGIPEEVKEKLYEIEQNEDISFADLETYLDLVSIVELDSISENVVQAVELDGIVTEEEQKAQQQLLEYFSRRMADECDISKNGLTDTAIENSIAEYSDNIDKINEEFKERTKLQDKDIAFLALASALQVARVLVLNALTDVEAAGSGNAKESALHETQEKFFKTISCDESGQSKRLYASTNHILSTPGVPYDATKTGEDAKGLFKGANHRFSTLGHDPLLGLVFGTSNIMTNSITGIKNLGFLGRGISIPVTFTVNYDGAMKNPIIGSQVGTIEMLAKAANRVIDDRKAASASLIKQVIHIGTDLYTPCGIQLPFANVILDNSSAEKLTNYVSTGDVLKVGAQAGLAVLINWLIATLHGSFAVFDGDDSQEAQDLYKIRTKKILLISDTIATSSSAVQAAIFSNPKCFDLGGAAVLAYRLFTDVRFMSKVKADFLNSGLDEIYKERAQGILYLR